MKLYNPFKPHIIVNRWNFYFIRKLGLFGWSYWNGYNWTGVKVNAMTSNNIATLEEENLKKKYTFVKTHANTARK